MTVPISFQYLKDDDDEVFFRIIQRIMSSTEDSIAETKC